MGFWDFLKPEPSLEEKHEASPELCFPHLRWKRMEPEGEDVWWLCCDQCHSTFCFTNRSQETGQLMLRYDSYWRMLQRRHGEAFEKHEPYFKKLFYKQFPDADTPNEELAERAREEFDKGIARSNALYDMMRQENLSKPHCPTCNSTDVQPISNVKRIASTAVMGIASSTIGKSYECKKCGYKW